MSKDASKKPKHRSYTRHTGFNNNNNNNNGNDNDNDNETAQSKL